MIGGVVGRRLIEAGARGSQRVEIRREPVDLRRISGELVDELRAVEPVRGVRVEITDPLIATGDGRRAHRIRAPPSGSRWHRAEALRHDRPRENRRPRMGEAKILLIEDSSDDVALTLRALSKNNIQNEVVVAKDGSQR